MQCDVKKFQYSNNQISNIGSLDITGSSAGILVKKGRFERQVLTLS
jgi:hypothetical protein